MAHARLAMWLLAAWLVGVPAVAGELLRNGDFEGASTNEWQRDDSAGDGKAVTTIEERHGGKHSLRLTPQPSGCLTPPCQLAYFQSLDTGEVVGRRLTVTGWYYSASGGDRGLSLRVASLLPPGSGFPACSVSGAGGQPGWKQLRLLCEIPEMAYAAQLRFVTTGTSGSIYVDDLSVTTSASGPGFSPLARALATTPLPADASLVMLSRRHGDLGLDGVPNFEVYAANRLGGNVVRLTSSGRHHSHVAVAPDRQRLVVARFTADADSNGRYDALVDPQALWLVDLAAGTELQLLPEWYWSGLGGVDWTPDGEWIVFGMYTGPYCRVYKVRPDGSELTLVSRDLNWASDVAVSGDGEWIAYHSQERSVDGSFAAKGEIWTMRIDGSDARRVTDGGPFEPAMQGGWAVGDFDPEFSPDGTQLVLAANNPASGGFDLVRVGADGSGRTVLVSGSPTRWAGIPDWGENDVIVYSLWQGGAAPYQGGALIRPDGTGQRLLEPGLVDPTDGGLWARWIPSLPAADQPRVRRPLRGGGG